MYTANNKVIFVLCVFFFIVSSVFTYADPVKWWDETIYLNLGYNLLKYGEYSFEHDFADIVFGWPNAGYRGPVLPLLCGLVYIFFGDNLFFLNLIVPFFGALGILAVFLIGKEVWNEKAGIYAAIMMSFLSFYIEFSSKILCDVVAVTFTSFSILFFIRGYFKDYEKRNLFKIYFSIFLALAFLTRYTSIIVVLPLGLGLLISKKYSILRDKYFFISILVFLFVVSPWLVYSYYSYGNLVGFLLHSTSSITSWGNFNPWYFYVPFWLNMFSILIFPFVIGAYYVFRERKERELDFLIILVFFVYYVVISLIPYKEIRYMLPVIPSLCLVSGYAITKMKKYSFVIIGIIAFILVYTSLLYFIETTERGYAENKQCFLDVTNFIKNTGNSMVFTDHTTTIYFYTRKETRFLTNSIDEMIRLGETGYKNRRNYYLYSSTDIFDYRVDMKRMNKPLVFNCTGYELYRVT